jgi:hypothetical protein
MRTKYTFLPPANPIALPVTVTDHERLMNSREVAEMLGVDISWVKNHCTRTLPLLPYVQLGEGRYATRRFRRIDIIKFIDSRTRVPRA